MQQQKLRKQKMVAFQDKRHEIRTFSLKKKEEKNGKLKRILRQQL